MGLFSSPAVIPAKVVTPVDLSYLDSAYRLNQQGTSFTDNITFGTADTDRKIVVSAFGQGYTVSGAVPTSCTIGGVTATALYSGTAIGYWFNYVYIASVPTGTTGDVVINYSQNLWNHGISAHRLISPNSLAYDTDGSGRTGSSPETDSVSVPDGGAVVCTMYAQYLVTLTGVTTDFQNNAGDSYFTVGHDNVASAATKTATWSWASPSNVISSMVSFGPGV